MKGVLLYFLIPVGLLATAVVLGLGIYSLAKGGNFAKEHSNKLMRMRVTFQAITIGLIMVLVTLLQQGD